MYPSLEVSDFHRPWRLRHLSDTPGALAAVVAPLGSKRVQTKVKIRSNYFQFFDDTFLCSCIAKAFVLFNK